MGEPLPRDEGRAERPLSGERVHPAFPLTALVVLSADLASKLAVYHSLTLGQPPIRLLDDVLRLTYIHNAGAAFGLFQGSRWFFIGVSALSLLIILSLALSGRYRDRWMQFAFGLILGGALGNLADRIWLGVVIDFVQVGVRSHYWPVFNVADAGVTVGVILLALRLMGERPREDAAGEITADGG
jgi:signal peptidase II